LYFVLLHYWTNFLGDSEFSLRSFSALFATLSLPLLFFVAREILVEKTSVVLVMALYAVNCFQVWYARETRFYALLGFLSLASVSCALLWLKGHNWPALSGLVLSLDAALYTHNTFLTYLPGIAILWLVYPSERSFRSRLAHGLGVAFFVLLLYAPWVPMLREQIQRVHDFFWASRPGAKALQDSLCTLSGLDILTLQHVFRDQLHLHISRLFGYWTWSLAILGAFLLCVVWSVSAPRVADRRKTIAVLAYLALPVILIFVDSRISIPVYTNKVFVGSSALLPVIFCAPIAIQAGTRRKLATVLGILIFVGTALSCFGYLRRQRREDWRGVTEHLLSIPEKQRLVVVVPDYAQILVDYYARRLSKSSHPLEITGLLTQYQPPDQTFQKRILLNWEHGCMLCDLEKDFASGDYLEIDVALNPFALRELVEPTLDFIPGHCASVQTTDFHLLEVKECQLQARPAPRP
jgi:4-amino-4-deoxy-L-arabinose transferase-like glycosyltransferase